MKRYPLGLHITTIGCPDTDVLNTSPNLALLSSKNCSALFERSARRKGNVSPIKGTLNFQEEAYRPIGFSNGPPDKTLAQLLRG
ncbi:hypothetical protein SUGI_0889050 [Cryptomeria japonica]|nr:hypothetical protein SUGI_0889050 [Cryptomeria japonica]